ncbi:MAG TPA: anaerobic sulfatase maturase [Rubrivivax sp.]|nr:anaerobic sulfatase maturase [Rubrivivax sp.]
MTESTRSPACRLPPLPAGRAYRFHAMVKPAGALCNLDCPYCFYLHKTELLEHERNARMSDAVLEQHVRQYLQANTGDEVVFSWQGGEPTVMGLPFFERVVQLQQRWRKPGQRIENDLQTNGVLLDEAWVAFLKAQGFMVGLSIDGPAELHDRYRPTKGGGPTHAKVMHAATLLREAEVPFAALCVVNRDVAHRPLEVYRFLVDQVGAWRIQFTPCVESRQFKQGAPALTPAAQMPVVGSERTRPGHALAVVTDWSVDAREYGRFLCTVWDEWLARDFGRIHVNLFETAVAQSLGLPAQMCTSAPICGKALALEHDGRLYSCDHFVYPEYELGRITDVHEGDLAFSPRQTEFGTAKHDRLPAHCRECPNLTLCWGECPKNRLLRTPDGEAGLNYLCEGLKAFYARVARDMPDLRRRLGR